jgi:hypothetical protein
MADTPASPKMFVLASPRGTTHKSELRLNNGIWSPRKKATIRQLTSCAYTKLTFEIYAQEIKDELNGDGLTKTRYPLGP